MGKRGKKEECSVCKGKGGWNETDDGNRRWVQCWGCSGTGEV
ncbi:hypothetical protein CLV63_12873 [Murinocardiopsis flavida]|uniref:Uncharacterized protein n=1 Tax=Murinocardiopsis flavida TaxID=645275 RepID=A0A2P8CVJ3_9ACTN|nr:hypothetical protein CLV63_12873 [Murinocardiopsis flavida]